MLNYGRQFFKIRVVFHTLYLWNELGDPQFVFAFLTQVTHLTVVTILKNLSTGKFSLNNIQIIHWNRNTATYPNALKIAADKK